MMLVTSAVGFVGFWLRLAIDQRLHKRGVDTILTTWTHLGTVNHVFMRRKVSWSIISVGNHVPALMSAAIRVP